MTKAAAALVALVSFVACFVAAVFLFVRSNPKKYLQPQDDEEGPSFHKRQLNYEKMTLVFLFFFVSLFLVVLCFSCTFVPHLYISQAKE